MIHIVSFSRIITHIKRCKSNYISNNSQVSSFDYFLGIISMSSYQFLVHLLQTYISSNLERNLYRKLFFRTKSKCKFFDFYLLDGRGCLMMIVEIQIEKYLLFISKQIFEQQSVYSFRKKKKKKMFVLTCSSSKFSILRNQS